MSIVDSRSMSEKSGNGEREPSIIDKFLSSLKEVKQNSISSYSILAASFRFLVGFAQQYFLPAYFLIAYPTKIPQIVILFSIQTVIVGIISSVFGGVLGDKFGAKDPSIYSKIAIGSSALALPCFLVSVLCNNFPLAAIMTNLCYLFGEASWGNAINMI